MTLIICIVQVFSCVEIMIISHDVFIFVSESFSLDLLRNVNVKYILILFQNFGCWNYILSRSGWVIVHLACRNDEGPTLLIIKDKEGYIYGGYASQPWEKHGDFYGDLKSFLFQLYPKAAIFRPTGANNNLQWVIYLPSFSYFLEKKKRHKFKVLISRIAWLSCLPLVTANRIRCIFLFFIRNKRILFIMYPRHLFESYYIYILIILIMASPYFTSTWRD